MNRREELQAILEEALGSRNVYFQPPESIKMRYPAIVYELSNVFTNNADNLKYTKKLCYTVTLIDADPESQIFDKIIDMPLCQFDRLFKSDGLHHFVFSLYY